MTTTTGDIVFEAEVILQNTVMLPTTSRCDLCGAQAYVEVEMRVGSQLLFCGHHFNTYKTKLKETAKRILDYRSFLLNRPSNQNGV